MSKAERADSNAPAIRAVADAEPAQLFIDALDRSFTTVGGLVPGHYEAYARILHPDWRVSREAEVGYAMEGVKGRALRAPYLATESAESGEALKLGVKLTSGGHREMQLELSRRHNDPDTTEKAVELNGMIRWYRRAMPEG